MAISGFTSNFDFSSSLSPSQRIDAAKYFAPKGAAEPALWEKAQNLSLPIDQLYGKNAPDLGSIVGLDSSQFLGGLSTGAQGWTFITAPQDISWDTANAANRVDMFGTNNPPVVAGSRGMRDLNLSDSLVEGFIRGKNVEAKISALEDLLNYKLNPSDGFVSVPVYQIWANNKSYGGEKGYFIIKSVRVKEDMRDTQGNATRAKVDISLMQVPEYQVNTGRDQAGQVTAGNVAITPEQKAANSVTSKANNKVQGPENKGGTPATTPGSNPAAGPNSAQPQKNQLTPTDLTQRQTFRNLPSSTGR